MFAINAISGISWACFRSLLRDKVFLPAVFVGFFMATMTVLISDFTVEDFTAVVTQVALICFHFSGIAIAVIWGTRIMGEVYNRGIVESQLASPISRSYWIIGNFLGLAFALALIWCIFITFFHVMLTMYNFDGVTANLLKAFILQGVLWGVVGSLVFFFGSFCRPATMLFCSVSMWIVGLITFWINQSIRTQGSGGLVSTLLGKIALIWDLSRLNLANKIYEGEVITNQFFYTNLLYGLCLLCFIVLTASIIFNKKDIVG